MKWSHFSERQLRIHMLCLVPVTWKWWGDLHKNKMKDERIQLSQSKKSGQSYWNWFYNWTWWRLGPPSIVQLLLLFANFHSSFSSSSCIIFGQVLYSIHTTPPSHGNCSRGRIYVRYIKIKINNYHVTERVYDIHIFTL